MLYIQVLNAHKPSIYCRIIPAIGNKVEMTNNPKGKDQPIFNDLISLEDAAKLSRLSHDHLRRLAGQGELWAKKIGRNWVTTEQAVTEYLARNRRTGPKKNN